MCCSQTIQMILNNSLGLFFMKRDNARESIWEYDEKSMLLQSTETFGLIGIIIIAVIFAYKIIFPKKGEQNTILQMWHKQINVADVDWVQHPRNVNGDGFFGVERLNFWSETDFRVSNDRWTACLRLNNFLSTRE